jgi:hypothetical protein
MEIYTGNKQIKGKTFCGTTYLPLSSLYETGLVEIELKKDNDINFKLIKFIINDDFVPLKSYRDGENNEIKVSIEDISKILNLWTKDLKVTGSCDGPYIALSSESYERVTVSYEQEVYDKISTAVKSE